MLKWCFLLAVGLWMAASAGCSRESASEAATGPTAGNAATESNKLPPPIVDEPKATPAGMVWVPGGRFVMGTNDLPGPNDPNPDRIKPDEYPAHIVEVDGFWMDETPVTNRQFREFVEMTGHRTFAERTPTREELIRAGLDPSLINEELLRPTSICFNEKFDRENLIVGPQNWEYQVWTLVEGANWQHPEGPDSSIADREDHPVVHITWDDAVAYCNWAGKRLPTEAEFEYAARSGGRPIKYPWGNGLTGADNTEMCNYFQGTFPIDHQNRDGFQGTSPVKSFPPNDLGLFDMAGNVWEWCHDLYDGTYYQRSPVRNPRGPEQSYDPFASAMEQNQVKRVQRGGSFMCNTNNCTGYRCGARMRGEEMSSSFHTGFRCVVDTTMVEEFRLRQSAIATWRSERE